MIRLAERSDRPTRSRGYQVIEPSTLQDKINTVSDLLAQQQGVIELLSDLRTSLIIEQSQQRNNNANQ